jgi:hypothetical protein
MAPADQKDIACANINMKRAETFYASINALALFMMSPSALILLFSGIRTP